eukprot:5080670-Prymnesium_polylepis.1
MPGPLDRLSQQGATRTRKVAVIFHATRRYRSKSEKSGRSPRASQAGLAVSRTPGRSPPPPCIMPPRGAGGLQHPRILQRSPPQSPADRADRRRSAHHTGGRPNARMQHHCQPPARALAPPGS